MEAVEQVTERVRAIASPIVRALGLELVEVVCSGHGPRTLVRVFIDKPGGIQVADCESVHHSLGHALDVEDPIPHAYTLEVSSPGLDRPFRNREEYQKSIEKKVRVKLKRPSEGHWRVSGRLVEVEASGIVVTFEEGRVHRTVRLPWEDIVAACREVELGGSQGGRSKERRRI